MTKQHTRRTRTSGDRDNIASVKGVDTAVVGQCSFAALLRMGGDR